MSDPIAEIWSDDLLKRRADAELLIDFLQRRFQERQDEGIPGAYTINLNAGWGHGKTFFLERLEKHLAALGHLTTYVNGWRDDASNEPLVAVMAALERTLKPYFKKNSSAAALWEVAKVSGGKVAIAVAKGALRRLATKYVGEAVEEVSDIIDTAGQKSDISKSVSAELKEIEKDATKAVETTIDTLATKYLDSRILDYEKQLEASSTFKARLNEILASLGAQGAVRLPLVVMIDELDRCRPTYAIEMLEQVKHLFDVENTTFIIATDGDQLAHSVSAIYGNSFDGKAYLRRFFNRHYKFEQRNLSEFVRYLFDVNKIDLGKFITPYELDPVDLFVGAMKRYGITLRDAEQCFDILRSVATLWDKRVPIELSVILPLVITYQQHQMEEMAELASPSATAPPVPVARDPWKFNVKYLDDHRRQVLQPLDVDELNRRLVANAHKPLPNAHKSPGTGVIGEYVTRTLSREFATLHGNTSSGEGPKSIILEYPALVRRVGRLSVDPESARA